MRPLGDKETYVIVDGRAYTGRVVVWRAPCQMPGDVEVWTAKELPSDHGAVPNNAVIVSAEGFANSGMAGGDFDGDLNMVCWDPDLIKIVKDTEAAVEALSPVGLEEDIVAMIRSAAEEVRVRDEPQAELLSSESMNLSCLDLLDQTEQ